MKRLIEHPDCRKGLMMLAIGAGFGINGEHSTLTMIILAAVAAKGLNLCLQGAIMPQRF